MRVTEAKLQYMRIFLILDMNQDSGKYIILMGAIIIVTGVVIYFFPDALKWFGRLPGDIRIERKNFRFYFPLLTMLILSIVITLIINIIKKIW